MELLLLVIAFGAIVVWYSWNKTSTAKYDTKVETAPYKVPEPAETTPTPLVVSPAPQAEPLPEVVAPAPTKTRGRKPGVKTKPAAKTKPAVKTAAKTSRAAKATNTKKK